MDRPGFQVKPGDEITLKEKSLKNDFVVAAVESSKGRGVPEWLELDLDTMRGQVVREPQRSDITFPIEEQLIVELYSK